MNVEGGALQLDVSFTPRLAMDYRLCVSAAGAAVSAQHLADIHVTKAEGCTFADSESSPCLIAACVTDPTSEDCA